MILMIAVCEMWSDIIRVILCCQFCLMFNETLSSFFSQKYAEFCCYNNKQLEHVEMELIAFEIA